MDKRYHINPETGKPGVCSAKHRCRFGASDSEHYGSSAEAQAAYEVQMDNLTDALKKVQNEISERRELSKKERSKDFYAGIDKAETMAQERGLSYYEARELVANDSITPDGNFTTTEKNAFISELAMAQPDILDRILVEEGKRQGKLDHDGTRSVSGLKTDIEALESSSGRRQYGFPEDEMIRHNIETKIGKLRKELTVTEFQKSGFVAATEGYLAEPFTRYGRGGRNSSEAYQLHNSLGNPLGHVRENYAGDLKNRSFTVYGNNGQELSTVADLAMAKEVLKGSDRLIAVKSGALSPVNPGRFNSVGVPAGKTSHESAFMASIQYNKYSPGEPPLSASEIGTKTILVPDVKNLTNKRRLEIGKELWQQSGRSMEAWENGSEEAKIRFTQARIGKVKNIEINADNNNVGWTHDSGGGFRNADEISIMKF